MDGLAILTFHLVFHSNTYLVTASIKHSQWLSVAPAKAWIGDDGIVLYNCMAGLGEACSHIAVIIFTLHAKLLCMQKVFFFFMHFTAYDFSAPDSKW